MEDFVTELEILGLTQSELIIYTSLCELGKAGAYLISKRTGKKRTTVYSCLDSLVNKGLVSIERGKTSSIFSANKPESILRGIEQEKELLSKKERIANNFVKQISNIIESQKKNIPKMKYVEGKEGVDSFLSQNVSLWNSSISEYDNIWWGFQDPQFVEEYRTWLNKYWESKSDKVKILLLTNESNTEISLKGKVRGREVKTLPSFLTFASTIWVCGDYIIMIVARDKPHYAFQIYDKVFSENLRALFQVLWKSKQ